MKKIDLSPVKKYASCLLVLIGLLFFNFRYEAYAQGDLLITPRRIVFEGNKQREEITLANTGSESATYSVSFVQYHMTDDGSFEVITDPLEGQMFADPYLRFFPRQVTLEPGESQVVRMQLRRLPGMVDGEYRSHIYFRAVPDEKPLGEEEMVQDSTTIGIRITPIFGITIPAIIRVGNLSAGINFTDMRLEMQEDGPPVFSVTFNRTGNKSVFGDLSIDYMADSGKPVNVGIVRGIAVYTPNTFRRFSMLLNPTDGIDFSKGKLMVRYTASNEANPETFATAEFIIH